MLDPVGSVAPGQFNLTSSKARNCDLLVVSAYTKSPLPDNHTVTPIAREKYQDQIEYTVHEQRYDSHLLRVYDFSVYLHGRNDTYTAAIHSLFPETFLELLYPDGLENGINTENLPRNTWHRMMPEEVEILILKLAFDLKRE